jgi:hypothetical protein
VSRETTFTSWNVSSDTVTAIDVTLRHPPLVSETDIDLTRFKKIRADFDMIDHYYYLDPDNNGFAIEAGPKYVSGYHYRPGIQQRDLLCEASNKP